MNQQEFERYDTKAAPQRSPWYLLALAYVLSAPAVLKHRTKITRIRMEGIKPPYILLSNHNCFFDFKVAMKQILPHRFNPIVAIDGFVGFDTLLRRLGGIAKRKFTNDVMLIRQIRRVIQNGDICLFYPEARYSLCGTTAVLPNSLGTLCKMMKAPVITMICHGHHTDAPFWNIHPRGVKPTEAEITLQYTPEELEAATPEEINKRLVEAFQYDDFAWQKERGIRVTYKKRAEGLEKVLYQCPHCKTEYRMASEGTILYCKACGKRWQYTELGELQAEDGETEFPHIPDWYEWERMNVRAEVEAGTYDSGELPVTVRTLPNAKKLILLGEGKLRHNMDGFKVYGSDVDGDPFEMVKTVPSLYSCHIEYNFMKKYGDCLDTSTLEDTWFSHPHDCDYALTKMALATEELYQKWCRDNGRINAPGLA